MNKLKASLKVAQGHQLGRIALANTVQASSTMYAKGYWGDGQKQNKGWGKQRSKVFVHLSFFIYVSTDIHIHFSQISLNEQSLWWMLCLIGTLLHCLSVTACGFID